MDDRIDRRPLFAIAVSGLLVAAATALVIFHHGASIGQAIGTAILMLLIAAMAAAGFESYRIARDLGQLSKFTPRRTRATLIAAVGPLLIILADLAVYRLTGNRAVECVLGLTIVPVSFLIVRERDNLTPADGARDSRVALNAQYQLACACAVIFTYISVVILSAKSTGYSFIWLHELDLAAIPSVALIMPAQIWYYRRRLERIKGNNASAII